ncbi:TPA_asm: hypothetical protein CBHJFHIM_00004 [Methanobrevibacter gottschalkii virus vir075]|uniref:Uncharacterized protein n=1 Tax=Methanobrevibacter gottschalkii TaxID=190974 RepID=A0A1H7I5H1_9EURY|nr:hypothetical protein SAMN05216439_1139 [Methanobrevibacter gottschalkii]
MKIYNGNITEEKEDKKKNKKKRKRDNTSAYIYKWAEPE